MTAASPRPSIAPQRIAPDCVIEISDAAMDSSGNEAVLLVEDDVAVRRVLCRGMQLLGYHVLEATDGEDALQVADRHGGPIHLVITDVVMPNMTGRELFERMRGWYPTIRFLFISGYSEGPGSDISMDGQHTEFLPKPFTVDGLARASRALLDQSAPPKSSMAGSNP